MKPRKLKSGNWNIQVFDYRDAEGKRHYTSITAPTKQECTIKAALYKKEHPKRTPAQEMTVGAAIDRYIELYSTLSPSTLDRYRSLRTNGFQSLMNVPVRKLSQEMIQRAINQESQRMTYRGLISAKTVKNEWGLVAASLHRICGLTFEVVLPKVKRRIEQYPDDSDVFEAILDSGVELPCLLSIWLTFTMSEILGLKCSSIKDGYIYINQVRVSTKEGLIEKEIAKTSTRNRVAELDPYLLDMIEKTDTYKKYMETGIDDYLISQPRSTIYHSWKRACKRKGLDLSFHDLRHMSASIATFLGVPDKYNQDRGGWSTPSVLNTNYKHSLPQQRRMFDQRISEYMTKSLNELSERKTGTH